MTDSLLYLDPGSGSYLVQVIVAAAMGVLFFFKNIKLYILSLFRRSPKKQEDKTSE
ncbi:MAG: hypothetical protein J0H92_08630 [Sphingobacteriales bacterium]|jgi:hypothetical protein|nr:hypothetical protein [Sphingobacteriales bacterium]